MHFRADVGTLLERLAARDPGDSVPITPAMLAYLASVYDEPHGEGDELAP